MALQTLSLLDHCLYGIQISLSVGNLAHQRELGIALNNLGRVRESQGQLDEALSLFDQSRKISETLSQREPGNLAHRRDLGIALLQMSKILAKLKRKKQAVSTGERAEKIFNDLMKRNAGFGDTASNLKAATSLIRFARKQGY